jgi:A/G-specific adenine glycosylase
MNLSSLAIKNFRHEVLGYYERHGRKMPWRETADPYCILVSEIMLQQTQVNRVVDKYNQFVAAFPDFTALSHAPLSRVMAVWQGLGYNRRALALSKLARIVVDKYNGELPASVHALATLPGIGLATASSICAFAFNAPVAFIETNIRTVFIHHFFKEKKKVSDKDILPLVKKCLHQANPRKWYWALMDYGVMLKKAGNDKNTRSAHYVKQTNFEGSKRQVRGKILKTLVAHKVMSLDQLRNQVPDVRVADVVGELIREGFVQRGRAGLRFVRTPA